MTSISLSRRALMWGSASLGGLALLGACASAGRAHAAAPMRFVERNGVSLRTQAFGNPRDPAVLLIIGATAPMRFWPDEFCARIAGAGRYVIRYDNRDTGQSTSFPPGAPGYTIRDLANDAAAILDAYSIERAHVVGWSMGGMITQQFGIYHPERVRSLLLFATSPDATGIGSAASGAGVDSGALPLPPQETFALLTYLAQVDWTNREAAITAWSREQIDLMGRGDVPEPEATRAIVTAAVDDARDIVAHRINHPIVVATSPGWRSSLGMISAPTLVMHGTDDKALPLEHGRALAREIRGARIIEVEGMGHTMSPHSRYLLTFADALIAHTRI